MPLLVPLADMDGVPPRAAKPVPARGGGGVGYDNPVGDEERFHHITGTLIIDLIVKEGVGVLQAPVMAPGTSWVYHLIIIGSVEMSKVIAVYKAKYSVFASTYHEMRMRGAARRIRKQEHSAPEPKSVSRGAISA